MSDKRIISPEDQGDLITLTEQNLISGMCGFMDYFLSQEMGDTSVLDQEHRERVKKFVSQNWEEIRQVLVNDGAIIHPQTTNT